MPSKSSKGGRSSKTARVLSLLTDPSASGAERAGEEEVSADRTPARPDDRATQDQIRDALVGELFGRRNPAPRKSGTRRNARSQEERAKPRTPPEEEAETEAIDSAEPSVRPFAPPVVRPEDFPQDAPAENFAQSAPMEEIPQSAPTEEIPQSAPYEPEPPQYAPQNAQPSAPETVPANPPQYAQEPLQAAPQQPMQYVPPVESITQSVQYEPEPPQYAPQQNTQSAAPQPVQAAPVQEPKPPVDFQPQTAAADPPPQSAPVENTQGSGEEDDENPDDFICYNLTQALVEDKAEKYMSLFGMCTCRRCKVDVTAIALSHLPSKYVATQSRDVVPLLSLYEAQNSAQVITEVMNACKKVMSRPHHGR